MKPPLLSTHSLRNLSLFQTKKFSVNPPKKQSAQPTSASASSKVETTEAEEKKDKFSFLDNVCCAPYKLLLMPVTKLAGAVAK